MIDVSPNKETANVGQAQLVEPRHVNPEVAGSSPALVNFSLFIQIYLKMYFLTQFPLWFITWRVNIDMVRKPISAMVHLYFMWVCFAITAERCSFIWLPVTTIYLTGGRHFITHPLAAAT